MPGQALTSRAKRASERGFHAVQAASRLGQFSGLGDIETGSILLQLVPEAKTGLKNRAHPDITVADVERAVEEVMALGGALIKPLRRSLPLRGGHRSPIGISAPYSSASSADTP